MKEIFLASYFGGLGDSLQFSTLPELYAEAGHDVYIWDKAYFRNLEIKELVWGCNPYIKGTKAGEWNAGDTPFRHQVLNSNCVSNWEMLHGFEARNKYPKIYYTPRKISGLKDTFLVDLTAVSTEYELESVKSASDKIKDNYPRKIFRDVKFSNNLNPPSPSAPSHNGVFRKFGVEGNEPIQVENIFKYCDLIYSSYGIMTLHNGASHLSCAIKEYNEELLSFCLIPEGQFKNNKQDAAFIFDNINYIMV